LIKVIWLKLKTNQKLNLEKIPYSNSLISNSVLMRLLLNYFLVLSKCQSVIMDSTAVSAYPL